jgi:hypothetical protein
MRTKLLLTGVAALFLATGTAHAVDFCEDDGGCIDVKGRTCYKLSNCCKNPHDWATEGRDKTVCTVRQMRSYLYREGTKDLVSIGIFKKDAKRIARDPGVKKDEWGWVCEIGESIKHVRVKGVGTKYKRNAVCE